MSSKLCSYFIQHLLLLLLLLIITQEFSKVKGRIKHENKATNVNLSCLTRATRLRRGAAEV